MKLAAVLPNPNETVLATVKRVAPLVPQIAQMFGISVAPGANSPRPLRPTRPVRPKGKPAPTKAPQAPATPEVVAAPEVATAPEVVAAPEAPSTSE